MTKGTAGWSQHDLSPAQYFVSSIVKNYRQDKSGVMAVGIESHSRLTLGLDNGRFQERVMEHFQVINI